MHKLMHFVIKCKPDVNFCTIVDLGINSYLFC